MITPLQIEFQNTNAAAVSEIMIDFGVPTKDAARPPESGGVVVKDDTQHLKVNAAQRPAMAVHAAFNIARRRSEDFTGR